MTYNKEDFLEMIRDWKADNSPEMDDLEIEEIEYDEEKKRWVAPAHDEKKDYCLTDDGTGNLIIY